MFEPSLTAYYNGYEKHEPSLIVSRWTLRQLWWMSLSGHISYRSSFVSSRVLWSTYKIFCYLSSIMVILIKHFFDYTILSIGNIYRIFGNNYQTFCCFNEIKDNIYYIFHKAKCNDLVIFTKCLIIINKYFLINIKYFVSTIILFGPFNYKYKSFILRAY